MQSAAVIGSSPLTRGKPGVRPHCQRRGRLIPAHAGKTMGSSPNRCSSGAHPRSRGENNRIACGLLTICGSSPLTRGKLPDSEGWTPLTRGKHAHPKGNGHGAGLIPAHAGKTCHARARHAQPKAHPRSRGENVESRTPVELIPGSSPLTRGKRRDGMGRARGSLAHPRSRGENPGPLSG